MYAQSSLLKFILMKREQGRKGKGKKGLVTAQVGGGTRWQLGALLREKAGFLAAVFGTLIFQLLIVLMIVKMVPNDDPLVDWFKRFGLLSILLQFALIICLAIVPMPMPVKFAFFSLFAALVGFMLKLSLQKVPEEIVRGALIATIAVFVFFVLVGLIISGFGIDLGPLGFLLLGVLLLLVIVSVVSSFMKTTSVFKKGLAIATIFLFSIYVVFDTNQILVRDYAGDFVTAALDYFLDILNLFLSIVSYTNSE